MSKLDAHDLLRRCNSNSFSHFEISDVPEPKDDEIKKPSGTKTNASEQWLKEKAILKQQQAKVETRKKNNHKYYSKKIVTYNEKELSESLELLSHSEEHERGEVIRDKIFKHGAQRWFTKGTSHIETKLSRLKKIYPNFAEMIDDIITQVIVCRAGKQPVKINSILLDGPPGIGKTMVAKAISDCFNYPYIMFDLSSAQAAARLSGSESFWVNSKTGELFNHIVLEGAPAVFVLLDEIDKSFSNEKYSPTGALYGLLEKSSAQDFRDLSFRQISIDLTPSIFFATCNNINKVDTPILDRMDVYRIQKPSNEQLTQITKNIYKTQIKELGLEAKFQKKLHPTVIAVYLNRADISMRAIQRSLHKGIGLAIRDKRSTLKPSDIKMAAKPQKMRIGF